MLYAHSLPDKNQDDWQTLSQHLLSVATLAGEKAAAFKGTPWAEVAGLLHDLGKASTEFQNRLKGNAKKVDHASAGAQHLQEIWGTNQDGSAVKYGQFMAKILGYAIAGHHSGLMDCGSTRTDIGTLTDRLQKKVPGYHLGVPLVTVPPFESLGFPPFRMKSGEDKEFPFALSFFVRMIYSCLTDADFLDTEAFCSPQQAALRRSGPTMNELLDKLETHLKAVGFLDKDETAVCLNKLADEAQTAAGSSQQPQAIKYARQSILKWCLAAGEEHQPGAFTLTVPTGGGKTLSSLAFALKHAQKHNLRRIIMVVPYTSIIEQNAQIFRDIFGEEVVLEHHSNYIHPDDLEDNEDSESDSVRQYRLSTENWNASLIVTTSVQFFESLFACRSSRCRKLHNIAKSVVILDEAQMIPQALLEASVAALKELLARYGVSLVFCTATQPALTVSAGLSFGLDQNLIREIIPAETLPDLFKIFDRTKVVFAGTLTDEELAATLLTEEQVLCIVNSRRRANHLFSLVDDNKSTFHLSSLMTPSHRTEVFQKIREILPTGGPCRVISTSLIECGVDISFPAVFREINGLDTIAQAAGRCNRGGESSSGRVTVFNGVEGFSKFQGDLQRRAVALERVKDTESLFSPQVIERYFTELYKEVKDFTDENKVMAQIRKSATQPNRFNFREMAQSYRFIDKNTVSIIIENQNSRLLIQKLKGYEPIPAVTLRKLQAHTVSVYYHEWQKLNQDRRLECLRERFFIFQDLGGYSDKVGLILNLENGLDPHGLVY